MVSVRNVIVEAYRMAGMLSDGQALDGTQSLIGVNQLNSMVSALNLEGFFAFSLVQLQYTPTVAKLAYTIGTQDDPGWAVPDISAVRPASLRRVYIAYTSNGVPMELPIVGPQDIYQFRPTMGSQGAPRFVAYLSDYPYGQIQFNIAPSDGFSMFVIYNKAIPVAEFNDNLTIPPEYTPALTYGLAYLLAVRGGRPPEVIAGMQQLRQEAYQQIRDNVLQNTPLTAHLGSYEQMVGGSIFTGPGLS